MADRRPSGESRIAVAFVALAGVLLIVGALLPSVATHVAPDLRHSIFAISLTAFHLGPKGHFSSGGVLSVLFGAVLLLAAAVTVWRPSWSSRVAGLVLLTALGAGWVTVSVYATASDWRRFLHQVLNPAMGPGPWLLFAGSLLAVGAGTLLLGQESRSGDPVVVPDSVPSTPLSQSA
jgi:hypothetical protein